MHEESALARNSCARLAQCSATEARQAERARARTRVADAAMAKNEGESRAVHVRVAVQRVAGGAHGVCGVWARVKQVQGCNRREVG